MTRGIVPAITLAFVALTACDVSQKKPKVESVIHAGSHIVSGHAASALAEHIVDRIPSPRELSDDKGTRLRGPGISPQRQTRI